tara:strand:+ start:15283 stop:16302 length:1020 start_codon:yes stop_codon:yes gene_type:complete
MASYFRQVPNFEYVSRTAGEQNISDYIEVKNLFKRGKLREDIFGNLTFFTKYKIIGNERPDNVAYKIYNDETLDWVVLLSNNILNIQSEWPLTQQAFDKVMFERYGDYETLYGGIHHYESTGIVNSNGVTILPEKLRVPNTWNTNGNFIEVNNTKISQIFSGNGVTPTTTVTVTVNNGIYGLSVGSQVTINNVVERVYNGTFVVTSALIPFEDGSTVSFTYELTSTPNVAIPTLVNPRTEEVLLTIESPNGTGNSYYYEYYDDGLGYSVQIPRDSFVRAVTNFEYENELEENKRNIFVLKPRYLNVVFNDMDDLMPYKRGSIQYLSENLKRGDNIRLYE